MRRAVDGRKLDLAGLHGATRVDLLGSATGSLWQPSGVRRTLNNQLRTGTDKGNLTV